MTPQEVVLILLVALFLFGPKKLPELSRGLGEAIREFRTSVNGEAKPAESAPLPVSDQEHTNS
jgi:sec-independent protein translocase protein TatA